MASETDFHLPALYNIASPLSKPANVMGVNGGTLFFVFDSSPIVGTRNVPHKLAVKDMYVTAPIAEMNADVLLDIIASSNGFVHGERKSWSWSPALWWQERPIPTRKGGVRSAVMCWKGISVDYDHVD